MVGGFSIRQLADPQGKSCTPEKEKNILKLFKEKKKKKAIASAMPRITVLRE